MKGMLLKNKKRIFIGAGVLIVLIIIGIIGYNVVQANKVKSRQPLTAVEEGDRRLNFWGEVKFDRAIDISIDFPAAVNAVAVREGDRVTLGQTLVTLDMSEYLLTLEKLRSQLAAASPGRDTGALLADIAQTQKDINTKTGELNQGTNADLKILQTALELAGKEADKARKDADENRALYEAGAVSEDTFDQYKDILDQREKALADVENNMDKLRKGLKTEIDQLNIALKSKRSQLGQIQIDFDIMQNKSLKAYIKDGEIVSSVENGIVQNIGVISGVKLGVQGNPTRVLQLIDADSIVVSAEVEEEFIKGVALGSNVDIVPVADSSVTIPGKVSQISNVAVEKDGKRIVKVLIKPEDPDGELKPGYSVDVYVPGD